MVYFLTLSLYPPCLCDIISGIQSFVTPSISSVVEGWRSSNVKKVQDYAWSITRRINATLSKPSIGPWSDPSNDKEKWRCKNLGVDKQGSRDTRGVTCTISSREHRSEGHAISHLTFIISSFGRITSVWGWNFWAWTSSQGGCTSLTWLVTRIWHTGWCRWPQKTQFWHILHFRNIVAKAGHLHFYVPKYYTFIPLSSICSIVWFFLLFFYILQLHNNYLVQYYQDSRARSPSFSPSRFPPQPRLRFQPRSRTHSSFSRPLFVSQLVSHPYFNLATRRYHPFPYSVLEFIRNPTAATRHITSQLAPSFVLFFRHGWSSLYYSITLFDIISILSNIFLYGRSRNVGNEKRMWADHSPGCASLPSSDILSHCWNTNTSTTLK